MVKEGFDIKTLPLLLPKNNISLDAGPIGDNELQFHYHSATRSQAKQKKQHNRTISNDSDSSSVNVAGEASFDTDADI